MTPHGAEPGPDDGLHHLVEVRRVPDIPASDVAVIGARHERWGETPVAVVVPSDPGGPPALDELTGWLRDRLASYKKPTAALVLVDELPRSAAGKVLKHELRSKYGELHR